MARFTPARLLVFSVQCMIWLAYNVQYTIWLAYNVQFMPYSVRHTLHTHTAELKRNTDEYYPFPVASSSSTRCRLRNTVDYIMILPPLSGMVKPEAGWLDNELRRYYVTITRVASRVRGMIILLVVLLLIFVINVCY